ncbi:MAG: tetratricopeptide repeat protein [Burkholderiales bacterium]
MASMVRPWRERVRRLFKRTQPPAAPPPDARPPAQPDAWLEAGLARLFQGEVAAVATLALARLRTDPQDLDARALFAAARRRGGGADEVGDLLRAVLAARHDHALAHAELAAVLLDAGEREAALDHSLLAQTFGAGRTVAGMAAVVEARLLAAGGDLAAALAALDRAGAAADGNPDAWLERASLLARLGRPAEAADAYRAAIARAPAHAAAWTNLGLVHLTQLGDPAAALGCFRRATALAPELAAAQANLALALDELGQPDAALAHLDALLAAHPGVAEYRWNRAVIGLRQGDFARGWDDYEARHQRTRGAGPRHFPLPEWDGRTLGAGAALLIHGEQGVGDEIMFASCIPEAHGRAGAVVLECDVRLASLFARSFPGVRVHGAPRDGDRRWLAAHPAVVCQSAIGALPRFLRREAAAFPAHGGYLQPDPARVAHWRGRLATGGAADVMGIAWRGGTTKNRAALRTMPLAAWAPVLKTPGVRWMVLQHDATAAELAEIQTLTGNAPLRPDLDPSDLDGLAALTGALDRVITVDNTLAHLAGALGRPVWIVLPQAADWRWGRAGDRTVWYPAARLWRQAAAGDWSAVAAALANALRADAA